MIMDKDWVERKRALIESGDFGSLFDADDALALLASHERLRDVARAAEDLAVILNTGDQTLRSPMELAAYDKFVAALRGSDTSGETKEGSNG